MFIAAIFTIARAWKQPNCPSTEEQIKKMWYIYTLEQGSPTPGPQTGTRPWPVRNRATQQEVSSGRASKASSAAPHSSLLLALLPEPSHPPIPLRPVEKLSSMKLVPGAKKFGDRCTRLLAIKK